MMVKISSEAMPGVKGPALRSIVAMSGVVKQTGS
jgi:hypothetical protein